MFEQSGNDISKVGIHKRFNESAVNFFKTVLSQLLSGFTDSTCKNKCISPFSAVNIKDSSKFRLSKNLAEQFPSYGSYGKKSALMNIQYEYDLISGTWKTLEFTQARRNDQLDSKETRNDIIPGSLNIRDLGYVTMGYLQSVLFKDAYFLNRLPKTNIYTLDKNEEWLQIDWKEIDNKIKKYNLGQLELEVYIGKKEKLKSRLVIFPMPDNVVKERLRVAKQGGKRKKGYQLSDEYRIKAHYNIFITNVSQDIISTSEIKQVYSLRWQIELVFKTWKSNLNLHKVKTVNKHRLLCQLLAKIIWILLNNCILQVSNKLIKELSSDKFYCSLTKFFKRAKTFPLAKVASKQNYLPFIQWYYEKFIYQLPKIILETRLNKPSHFQIIQQVILI